ncbi:MAG: hypothetical protein K2P81_12925 [Bacteriovoracaceae bacterium]|nr:hypothetical protein [Bacteriovoracaceae bacterium]
MWFFLFLIFQLFADDFSGGLDEWQSYGEGFVSHQKTEGYSGYGSLKILNDLGESTTVFKKWSNLKPGKYRFSAWIKSKNIKKSLDGYSLWHFYGSDSAQTSVFTDWNGKFDWKHLEYEVEVKDNPFYIWFRLKSPGEVILDDMTLIPASEKTFKRERVVQSQPEVISQSKVKRYLFNESSQRVSSQKYINYRPESYNNGNWSGYDTLELQITNPTKAYLEVYVSLGDTTTKDYWSQLNYKTVLSQGQNIIKINLNDYLGERGSHRFNRRLDLKKIAKFFVIIDPNNREKIVPNLEVKLLSLDLFTALNFPNEFLAFDFSKNSTPQSKGFIKVVASDSIADDVGYGFSEDSKFWRAEDSFYVPTSLRGTIGVVKGSFEVHLPNGEYEFQLIWDRLGYWDPSFWNQRYLEVNGKPFRKEVRSLNHYLDDLFLFENILPTRSDNPYDLYLKKIFKPLTGKFNVTNKKAIFTFEGDPTGISLNRLIIWPSKLKKAADKVLEDININEKKEYFTITRPLREEKISRAEDISSLYLSVELGLANKEKINPKLVLSGGVGSHPYLVIKVPDEDLTWRIESTDVKSKFKISNTHFNSFLINQRLTSPDMNHETYTLAAKELRPVGSFIKGHSTSHSRYLYLELPILKEFPIGEHKAELKLECKGKIKSFPLFLNINKYEVESLDFPVGFFGLNSLPANYFPLKGFDTFAQKVTSSTLDLLSKYGFTAFSGLPKDTHSDFADTKRLVAEAKKRNIRAIYSYGDGLDQDYVLNKEFQNIFTQSNIYFSYLFSDEVNGYSGSLGEDVLKAKQIKKSHSNVKIGGFGQMNNESDSLNVLFDDGFYTKIDPWRATLYSKKGQRWGGYNANPSNFDDPRFTFGPGLFIAREKGLTHYLEWQAHNNYPYLELDGRETDVAAWLPSREGRVYPTVRFMLAVEGLEMFKKLQVLKKRNHPLVHKLLSRDIFKSPRFLKEDFNFEEFKSEVDKALSI